MMIGVKRKQLCAENPKADGQTDMVIPVYPPNFVAGGIMILDYQYPLRTLQHQNTYPLPTPIFSSDYLEHIEFQTLDKTNVGWL